MSGGRRTYVCKAGIIPSCIWFLRLPQKSRRLNLPEGYHVRRTEDICLQSRHYTIVHLVSAFTAEIQALKSPGWVPCPEDMV